MIWLYSILIWLAFNGLAVMGWIRWCDYMRAKEKQSLSRPYLVRTAGGVR